MVLLNGFMNVSLEIQNFYSEMKIRFLDEIFNRNILLFWSPTDRYLAYIKINLTNSPKNHYLKYDLTFSNDEKYSIPYPKYNDSLPVLDVYIYNIKTGRNIRVLQPNEYENL